MKRIILFFIAICGLNCAETSFISRLEQAKSGDYIVLEAGQITTLLAIRSTNSKTLILEEISIPSKAIPKNFESWPSWVRMHAPGHTSWSMTEIDLNERQVLECYSFSKSAWVSSSSQPNLLTTLLSLPLAPIFDAERKKIGSPPNEGEADHRAIWNPPLFFHGKKCDQPSFQAFHATWPQDGSELSGKEVSLYFDKENRSSLPYWIQVDATHASASIRAIDSGKNLVSPYRTLPRRTPEFIGAPQRTKTGLRLNLKSPKYYKDFELFAIDVTEKEKQIHPIDPSQIVREGERLSIEIDALSLDQVLLPERKYTWLVVPTGYSESYTQTLKPFLWKEVP